MVTREQTSSEQLEALRRSQLHQEEADWERTFDAVPHAIFVLDARNRVLRANRAALDVFQCQLADVCGRPCYEVVHRTKEPPPHCPHNSLLKNKLGGRNELVEPSVGKAFDMTCSPIRDPQGALLGSVHVLSDITARKRAEEQHARLIAVLEATTDFVGLAEPDGTLTYCNNSGRKMLGLGEGQDLAGYNMEKVFPESWGGLTRHGRVPAAFRTETTIAGQEGAGIPVSQVVLAHQAQDGSLAFLSTIARDITERKRAEKQIELQLDRLAALRAIDSAINSTLDIQVTLSVFLDQVTTGLGVDAASVYLMSPHSQMLELASTRGFRWPSNVRSRVSLGDELPSHAVLERRVKTVLNIEGSLVRFGDASALIQEGFVSYIASPLIAKGHVNGVLEIWTRRRLDPNPEWLDFLGALAGQGAIAIDNASLYEQLQTSNSDLILAYDTTLEGWVKALDLRDNETEGHTRRVTELTMRLAYDYSVDREQLKHIRRGALLHDIGKMAVPDSILRKPAPLTPDEWKIMRQHPQNAKEWLSSIPYLRPAMDIPYCHHEKWDGSGYPRGLKADSIPLAARLFAVVDVWDALRSDRPYRAAWPWEKVISHIRDGAGTHFDPDVVEVFLKNVKDYAA